MPPHQRLMIFLNCSFLKRDQPPAVEQKLKMIVRAQEQLTRRMICGERNLVAKSCTDEEPTYLQASRKTAMRRIQPGFVQAVIQTVRYYHVVGLSIERNRTAIVAPYRYTPSRVWASRRRRR